MWGERINDEYCGEKNELLFRRKGVYVHQTFSFSPEKEKFLNSGTVLLIVSKIVEDVKKETRR